MIIRIESLHYLNSFLCQVIAGKLGELMLTLGQVEIICSLTAKYWDLQAKNFDKLAKEITSSEQLQKDPTFKPEAIEESLVKEKDLLEEYHKALTVVNSRFNFTSSPS